MLKIFSKLRTLWRTHNEMVQKVDSIYNTISSDLKSPKVNLGQIQSYLNNQRASIGRLDEVEFQIFSQFGDDGIIQYLVNKLDIPNKVFIEFGVENYKEANTRFLLINNKWSGLVMDGSKQNTDFIGRDALCWSNDLHVTHSFITAENINELISDFLSKGYPSEIGILSVDIDGNDYYVWKKIDVINPVIVICEYNAIFGDQKALTIPYDPDFYRFKNDHTPFYGASLKCLCILAEQKGYHLIGCNGNGNNAYFIRKDKIGNFKPLTCEDGFVEAAYREFFDDSGVRVYGKKRFDLIKGKKALNIETNELEVI